MEVSDARRLKELEDENRRLKHRWRLSARTTKRSMMRARLRINRAVDPPVADALAKNVDVCLETA